MTAGGNVLTHLAVKALVPLQFPPHCSGSLLEFSFCFISKQPPVPADVSVLPFSPGRALRGALDHGDPHRPQREEPGGRLGPLLHLCCFCHADGGHSAGHGGALGLPARSALALVSYWNIQELGELFTTRRLMSPGLCRNAVF